MKKLIFLLLLAVLLPACATSHQVGHTPHAAKAKKAAGERVGTQFIGVD